MQVLDLQETEVEQLCHHMGHNIKVHRHFYRLPEDALEITKVGKLLYAIEQGVDKYKGRKLDEITSLSDVEEEDYEVEGESYSEKLRLLPPSF